MLLQLADARSEESTDVDSEERRSLSEEKLLRSLSEERAARVEKRAVGEAKFSPAARAKSGLRRAKLALASQRNCCLRQQC